MATSKKSDDKIANRRRIGRELKVKYEYCKVVLLGLEKENYSHIFILKTADNWHKILSHSAILYKPIAKEKVTEGFRVPKLLSDGDFKDKAPIGVMSIRDLAALRVVLEKCGAKEDASITEADGDWIIAYKLDHKMTDKEFWSMEKEERELWDKANRLIVPKAIYPNLGIDIQEMIKLFYDVIRKQDKCFFDLLGRNALNNLSRLYTGLILAEKNYTKWDSYFKTAISIICDLEAFILMASSTRLIDSKVIVRMADTIARVEEDLKSAQKMHRKVLKSEK